MRQSLSHRKVCVMKLHILSDKSYNNFLIPELYPVNKFIPLHQIRFFSGNTEFTAYNTGEITPFKH